MPATLPPRRNTSSLLVGTALGLSVVIALFGAAVVSYASATEWVEHTVNVEDAVDDWVTAMLESETGALDYLVEQKPEFLATYEASLSREREASARMRLLVADNEVEIRNVGVADRSAQRVVEHLRDTVALVRAGLAQQAVRSFAQSGATREMREFRRGMRQIASLEARLLGERRARARHRAWLTLSAAFILTLASCGLLAYAWRLQRTRTDALDALAREAREQLETLSKVAMALSEARTRTQVADVVVDLGMTTAGADTCTLYMLDSSGTALELIGDRGVSKDVISQIGRISENEGNPQTYRAFALGETLWVENEAEYAAVYPSLTAMKASGQRAKAFWSVPLVAEGHPVGLLGMGFYEARRFSVDERAFVTTLSHQCAQALLRAARLEKEDEARSWFTTTLRSIGDAVIATDVDGDVTFMNPVAERLTGFTEKEAVGKKLDHVFRIFSERTRAAVESPVAKVLREGTVVGLANHTLLRSRNGIEIPIDDSGAPIRSEDGRMFGVVLVFRDGTQEKAARVRREFLARAGEVLVSSLDYHGVLANVADLAVPTLADYCAVDVVPAGASAPVQAAVSHVDPRRVQFVRQLASRYPRDPDAKSGIAEVVRSGTPQLYEYVSPAMLEGAAKDPEHLALLKKLELESLMIVPLRAHGRTFGAMSFAYAGSGRRYSRDDLAFASDFARRAAMAVENSLAIDELENSRAHEHALRSEAEVASRAKDEFLAMVSHELRTPLTAILGWAVMLRERGSGADMERGLAVIERNARAQTKLIEDVLDVSRIISGKLALSVGPTDVVQVIATAIETVTPAARAKEITVAADVPEGPLSITADADRLQQIVWNLLSNAVKFTPKGGRVTVRARGEGSDVCISVTDTGEGIGGDALSFVFEPFRQADSSTTRRHGGLGLGLAIVKQLVSAHGGTVHAESRGEGKGATFVVRLPSRAAVAAISRAPRPLLAPESAGAGGNPPRLDGLRVLVVDDEEDALDLVAGVLAGQGADVHRSRSAIEAVEEFGRVKPDVVVSDIGMPQMDGYSFIRKIRGLPFDQGGRTPAVALTAYARAEDARRAFAAGYQMHVTKPVEPDRLVNVVANLGGRSQDDAEGAGPPRH